MNEPLGRQDSAPASAAERPHRISLDPATGMRPGERYQVESLERTHAFSGFFLDGKYYLDPDLLTAVGWMEGQQFFYDDLDPAGEPVFADGVAGTIEDLSLMMADGAALPLVKIHVTVPDPSPVEPAAAAQNLPSLSGRWRAASPAKRAAVLSLAVLIGGCTAALLQSGRR